MSKKDAILASIFPRFWWILVDFGSQVGTENLAKWGLMRSGQVRSWRPDQVRSDTSFQARSGAFASRGALGPEGGEGLPRLIRVGPSPRPWTPRAGKRQSVLLRLFGHLDAIRFSIAFSMPLGIDLGSNFLPNLPSKIHQNPLKIDAKREPILDFKF